MTSQGNGSQQPLQKSRIQKPQLLRTPSTAGMKPQNTRYFENIDFGKTDKKRSFHDVGGQVGSVLMQQNKQLLAENREMAYAIHDRNKTIDEWQRKYNRKVQESAELMKAVETERQRFVAQVLNHKEETEKQLKILQDEISRLHRQKNQLEIEMNRERKRQSELVQKERKQELDNLSRNYKEHLGLMQAEIDKLKNKIDEQNKNQQLIQMENKQQMQKLRTEIVQTQQQVKHEQHLRRLQIAQSKQYYEEKMQQIHLEHRRHQEIFLTQHEVQIKRFEDEIAHLREQTKKKEEKQQIIQKQIQNNEQVLVEYQKKIQTQVYQVKRRAKEQLIHEKHTLQKILIAENEASKAALIQEINQLQKENQALNGLLKSKTMSLNQLYEEYDLLRTQHSTHHEHQEKLIKELQETLYSNEEQKHHQLEIFKIKTAQLREADIKGIKEIYQNQIKVLTQKLADKQSIITSKKQKIHGELAVKSQQRERYNIQFVKYKSQIAALNNKINDLQAQIFTSDAEKMQILRQEHQQTQNAERYNQKMDNFRTDEIQQLQSIIKAKDIEIEQLESKIQLLKDNQVLQANRKQVQINELHEKYSSKLAEKEAQKARLLAELQKLRLVLQTQKGEFEDNINSLNSQHSQEINKIIQEYNQSQADSTQEITRLKNQNRNLKLQLDLLKKHLEEEVVKAEETYRNIREHHKIIILKQKDQLQNFYKDKLKEKDESIQQLTQKNNELSLDMIDARENYTELEKKLEALIESQSGLREMQRKVMNMGKQNSKAIHIRSIHR